MSEFDPKNACVDLNKLMAHQNECKLCDMNVMQDEIDRLTAENVMLRKEKDVLTAEENSIIRMLNEVIERIEKERDAAIELIPQICNNCTHHDVFWRGGGCNLQNNGEDCNWEWCGIRKE